MPQSIDELSLQDASLLWPPIRWVDKIAPPETCFEIIQDVVLGVEDCTGPKLLDSFISSGKSKKKA
jgi:hypothetical protein